MKFHVHTFGCQMNAGDAAWLASAMTARGWEPSAPEDAGVFLVMTCSVREKPEQKVYSLLGRIAEHVRERPGTFVAVGGCVAQQIGGGFFERFPFVRLVFGTDGVAMAPDALEALARGARRRVSLLDFTDEYPERDALSGPAPVSSFVNVMQGCDNFCSYCIVPFVRGRQKSRKSADVLAECRGLVERGTREIMLLGQNVNSYGLDESPAHDGGGVNFAGLLRQVSAIPGLERLGFTTSHPKDLADEVADLFGELPNLSPKLHLPMQSGSDAILKRMGRRYSYADYLRRVARLRAARPDIALSTDLIVGFPSETEADFQATLDAVQEVGFESSFIFKYCDRPGTKASLEPGKVDEAVKAERMDRLLAAQETLYNAALAARVGTVCRTLVEGPSHGGGPAENKIGAWRGRDEAGRIVNFRLSPSLAEAGPAAQELTGRLIEVRVLEAKKHSLRGEAVSAPW